MIGGDQKGDHSCQHDREKTRARRVRFHEVGPLSFTPPCERAGPHSVNNAKTTANILIVHLETSRSDDPHCGNCRAPSSPHHRFHSPMYLSGSFSKVGTSGPYSPPF